MTLLTSATSGVTAVDAFAKRHDELDLPANARYYRDLIPLSAPGEGEQYAFEVDLDECTGCKSCVVACHSLNGLDEDESWRSVGLLQGSGKIAFQQTVTTACHHCVEPACLTGCPVNAYEKDETTGIVSHLDDQCIGCGYCTLTCPYEVPRFNEARGIVRKCDMCRGRLEVGEAPACVQSCPNGAIRISIISKSAAMTGSAVPGATLVPGAPLSAITTPTTVYRSTKPMLTDARAADHFALRPAHPHPPLAAMLVLTQLAVGALAVDVALRRSGIGSSPAVTHPLGAIVAAAFGLLALAASTMHLGRPRYAFRAVLGVSHSWLSREVVAFGVFAGLSTSYAVAVSLPHPPSWSGVLGVTAVAAGIAGVGSSVMLYAVTRRAWWRARRTAPVFALSGLSTGMMTALVVTAGLAASGRGIPAEASAQVRVLAVGVLALAMAKLVLDVRPLLELRSEVTTDLARSALLLRRDLWPSMQLRLLCGSVGGIVIPLAIAAGVGPDTVDTGGFAVACVVGLAVLMAGEVIERHHFFRVAVAPRMPGESR